MKRYFALLILLAAAGVAVSAEISISGLNYAEYAYSAAEDSLNNYFYDKLTFRLRYGNVTVGQSFIARLPEYKGDATIENLSPDDLGYDWDERWVTYDTKTLTLHAGTMDETIGRGLVLRAWEDREFDIDTRLEGAKLRWSDPRGISKAFYGARPIEFPDGVTRDETAAGIDGEVNLPYGFKLGGSYIAMQTLDLNDPTFTYGEVIIDASRLGYTSDLFDAYLEYAMLEASKEGETDRDGAAIYADATLYVGKFTLLAACKDYDDFHQRNDSISPLSDMPTVNHSGEPLSESGIFAGEDEAGFMGELTWRPDYYSEVVVNYAEAWSHDDNYTLADFYFKSVSDIGPITLTAEYEHIETRDEAGEKWHKKLTPQLAADFVAGQFPMTVMAQWEHEDKTDGASREYHWEPLLQADIAWREVSLSVTAEMRYGHGDALADQPVWLGAEIALPIDDSTSLRVFGGRQKGGKVCRNGICRRQSQFEGIKVELTTTF
ncbi:MAG: DUF6029 family protein [Candidatus Cloacimonetes bacterium]|nr:DUF6029 family protein [Candidatus Cloacimonadota bacterium]